MRLSYIIPALSGITYAFPAPQASTPDASNCTDGTITRECCADCYATLPDPYSLTAVKKNANGSPDPLYDGLKVESFVLFATKVGGYCPFTGEQASNCPNGTDMALAGTMGVLSLVPGGQDLYVTANGLISITVQHSHAFPPGSFPYYYGWSWTPYQVYPEGPAASEVCPKDDPMYNCAPPTGYWNFKAPDATVGGLMACPNEYVANMTSVYAVTPSFNRTDCVELTGLGTHLYTGVSPPVWAY